MNMRTPRRLRHLLLAACLLGAGLASASAHAEISLLGIGVLTGGGHDGRSDRSGLAGKLENGAPANLFEGMGSGLAYAGGGVFLFLPDRGPNASPYNPAVDNTTSFIPRVHTVAIAVRPAAAGAQLPLVVTSTLQTTTLLFSAAPLAYGSGADAHLAGGAPGANKPGRFYFSGRSDNFAPGSTSLSASNARLDPEGIRVARDGRSVFVSDEYGPAVYRFDRRTGQRVGSFALPATFAAAHLSAQGDVEIAGNASGRTANKGMEGLAITPDGKTLVGVLQAALRQDAANATSKKLLRLVAIDVASGQVREYAYLLTDGSGVSEILAINDHEFLLLERDGAGLGTGTTARVKKLYRIDLAGAREIGALSGAEAVAAAVPKTQVLDMVQALTAGGVVADRIPEKIEGIAFGPDVTIKGRVLHTLYAANDNDFLRDAGGGSLVYVFGFTEADVPGLVPQDLGK